MGYGLDKVNLGMIEPQDKPASKRKSRDAVSAKGTKSDLITLEEDCTEDRKVEQARASTSAGAESAVQPQAKKSRLESILSTANTKTA